MSQDQNIDIDFLKDKSTFEKIQVQKSIFIELFTEIANLFPQSKLAQLHPQAKGSKVSQGINLGNCPYQVLDIFRDFDLKTGLNIRILNWWGHGLYMLIQFGKEAAISNKSFILNNLSEYNVGNSFDAFDYKTILASKNKLTQNEFNNHLERFSALVLYREIKYQTSQIKQKQVLLDNINLILDKDC